WVLSACLPFVLAILAVIGLRATGVIAAAPPGPVTGEALTLPGNAVPILIGLLALIVLGFVVRWRVDRRLWFAAETAAGPGPEPANGRRHVRRPAGPDDPASPGAAAAFLLVLSAAALVIWVENPFAAGLIVPALHLWMW